MERVPPLESLAAAVADSPSAIALINCTRLGSRDLQSELDKAVHPVRGQVLALDAPWVQNGFTMQVRWAPSQVVKEPSGRISFHEQVERSSLEVL